MICTLWQYHVRQQHNLNYRLVAALFADDTRQARVLVEAGADPNTPCYPRSHSAFPSILSQLRHPLARPRTAFLVACGTDYGWSLEEIQKLRRHPDDRLLICSMIQHGADLNTRTDYNQSALLGAVTNNHFNVAKELLKHPADVNAQDNAGRTPLMWAVMDNEPEMVRLLLASGANVRVRDSDGNNAIYYSVWACSNPEIIRQLLEYHADPTGTNDRGESALTYTVNTPETTALLRTYHK